MAQPPADISSILAALAKQSSATPAQASALPQGYPGALATPPPPSALSAFSLPQPTTTGSVNLNTIKPVNSGTVSLADAVAKAQSIAKEKGLASYESGRMSAASREDPRLAARSYRRSRSRSRSPPRREYNPYRDERRDDPRRGSGHGRERTRSPRGRNTFSPPRYSGRERGTPAREDDNAETITIDSALVGLVIGRQGENLRRIEQDTGTRVQFLTGPAATGPKRECKISGAARGRIEAKNEIYRIIEENGGNLPKDFNRGSAGRGARNQPALREGENSMQIMVPDRTVGLIIGRGGETIRDLQERSGCHVNIVGENKSVNGLRPVNLIGSHQAALRAKELIMEIVESDTRSMAQGPQSGRGGHDPYDYGGGNKINDSITVPSEAVGMIIGKGGETIKEMQNSTGCKINVSQASGADIDREIGLVGSRQAIDAAKKAIWDKVHTVREKNGVRAKGGRDDSIGDRYSQQQPYGQAQNASQDAQQQPQQSAAPAAPGTDPSADPYAAWGGYQNYMLMWAAAYAQQQAQGQTGQVQQGQGEQQNPPGAS